MPRARFLVGFGKDVADSVFGKPDGNGLLRWFDTMSFREAKREARKLTPNKRRPRTVFQVLPVEMIY